MQITKSPAFKFVRTLLLVVTYPFAKAHEYLSEIDAEIADANEHKTTGAEAALQGSVTTSMVQAFNPS